jgi:branched-chain amino acid transport system permease protein
MALKGGARSAAIWFAVAIVVPFVPALLHRNGGAFVNFLADAGAFVLLALGLNIVVGYAGLLDLGYAAFFAIGSYTYAITVVQVGAHGHHVSFWLMLFIAAGVAAIFGILLGAPTLRLRGDYLAIVTLGFGEIVPQTFLNLTQFTGGPNGINVLDRPTIGAFKFGFDALPYYFLVLALIALTVWLANNMRNSRLGRAWMAIREDELAAAHMGINTTTTKLAAFAMGASFSGLAGCALASKLQLVSPDQFGFNVSVFILAMLVLGGMGNIPGVIAGSLILSGLERFILPQATNFLRGLHVANLDLSHIDLTNSRFLIYGSILVLMMLFRPEGLIPSGQRKAELHAADTDAGAAAQEQSLYTEAVR